jgi:hypothetical protein
MKLAGGSPSFAGELNVEAFLQQARSYEEAASSVVGGACRPRCCAVRRPPPTRPPCALAAAWRAAADALVARGPWPARGGPVLGPWRAAPS